MTNLFQRIALALSYIKGPQVVDWVAQKSHETVFKVFGNAQANPPTPVRYNDDDEALWNEFVDQFAWAFKFVDTAAAKQAYVDLSKLL